MYTTCLFCTGDLRRNEAVEQMPVGRRLAFDAGRGRLWVVCPRCERWNLTPLEERWEAIEACERLFRDSRLRVSTGEIGLARLADRTELVRIGVPQRPEFAAWRYGDQFGRRRRRSLLTVGAAVATGGALIVAGPVMGLFAGGAFQVVNGSLQFWSIYNARRSRMLLELADGQRVALSAIQQRSALLVRLRDEPSGWGVRFSARALPPGEDQRRFTLRELRTGNDVQLTLSGDEGLRALGRMLPAINEAGAREAQVRDAVRLIEEAGSAEQWLAGTGDRIRAWGRQQHWGDTGAVHSLPKPVRLALEMAAHEDAERAALEGELGALEQRWKEAEEIAAIADDLLLPEDVQARLRSLREEP